MAIEQASAAIRFRREPIRYSCSVWAPAPAPVSQRAQLEALTDVIDAEQQQLHAELMTLPQKTWEDAVSALPDNDIYHLMRFFTVAEMQLPGWEANDKSPVIWLNKILKARGKPLSKEQIQWIKQHTRNRFLPYGSAL